MHGVMRLIVTLDGEDVDCEPVLGYLHRGMEKLPKIQHHVHPLCQSLGLCSGDVRSRHC